MLNKLSKKFAQQTPSLKTINYKLITPLLASLLLLSACSQTPQNSENSSTPSTPTDMTKNTHQATIESQLDTPKKGDTIAVLETDFGTIKIKLFMNGVPELSKNFSEITKAGKYDSVPFHRVVKDFMIQGGDFTAKNGTGGYSYKGEETFLANEINPAYKHLYGTVSMAKSPAPVSIGSQFFIVTAKNGTPFLDGSYSPIGQVFEGMDVAEKIVNLQIPGTEKPSKTVKIKKATIETY